MNEMMENKYPYDNWKSITESDFVTLFIKTWFAFVSTLREMYPAEIPYYQATGDSRYISPYKRDFSQNIAYRLNYTGKDGAGDGKALLLPAGQGRRVRVPVLVKPKLFEQAPCTALAFFCQSGIQQQLLRHACRKKLR